MEALKPRDDEKCVDCGVRLATTKDKLFCLPCLRIRVRETNPKPYVARETRGRPARAANTLGGTAELREDEDETDA